MESVGNLCFLLSTNIKSSVLNKNFFVERQIHFKYILKRCED
jgi:hypothetical protein